MDAATDTCRPSQRDEKTDSTLAVALVGADGIVAAPDSRGTFGDPRATTAQNDTMTKLHGISSSDVQAPRRRISRHGVCPLNGRV
jgi:hypothetical protein